MGKKRSVTILGGLGMIGGQMASDYLRMGWKVRLCDDESKGSWRRMPFPAHEVTYLRADLRLAGVAEEAIGSSEVVYHLASKPYGIGHSSTHGVEMFHYNLDLNRSVLDAVRKRRPAVTAVMSSSCVYDGEGMGTLSDRPPLTGLPEKVNYGYGWAKRVLETQAWFAMQEMKRPVVIVRPFNMYGPTVTWQGKASQAIPMLVDKVMRSDRRVECWGSGNQIRNYLHTEDFCRYVRLLVEKRIGGIPVNVASARNITVRQLLEIILKEAGKDLAIFCNRKMPEGRLGKKADLTRLRKILGREAKENVRLENGILQMIGWWNEEVAKQ